MHRICQLKCTIQQHTSGLWNVFLVDARVFLRLENHPAVMLMQLMLYSLRRTKTLTHRCTHSHTYTEEMEKFFSLSSFATCKMETQNEGVRDVRESKCRHVIPFCSFPQELMFFLCLFFVWWTERGGKMRGGDRHTGCLVLSHTLALMPAPPGTTHSHLDFAHTYRGNISVQIVRSIVCLDKDSFCSFDSLQHYTWLTTRWISANTVATLSCCLFVSLCLQFCI